MVLRGDALNAVLAFLLLLEDLHLKGDVATVAIGVVPSIRLQWADA